MIDGSREFKTKQARHDAGVYLHKCLIARPGPALGSKLAEAILVFHAFQKTTQNTPKRELALARQRLNEVLHGNV